MSGFYTAYLTITGTIYSLLVTNLLMVVVNLPLVVTVVFTNMSHTWMVSAVAAPFLAPSLVAAFAVFRDFTSEARYTPFRTFLRGYREGFRRSIKVGLVATIALVVFGVDIAAMWRLQWGAVGIPVFVVLAWLTGTAALHLLVGLAHGRHQIGPRGWRDSAYLALRTWYLSALTGFAMLLLISAVIQSPAWGTGVLASPLLYLAWANTKFAMRPVLSASEGERIAGSPSHAHA